MKPKPRHPELQSTPHPSSTSTSTTTSAATALSDLQAQQHDTQTSLASHVDEMRVLEAVFTEHHAINHEGPVSVVGIVLGLYLMTCLLCQCLCTE